MPLSPGDVLNNRYRIVKLLGQGGFGAVYRAWDLNLNGPCAIKENFETTEAAQKQFNREASILFNLRHHNLPKVFDTFSIPGQGQYLVMEYIQGEDLEQMLERTGGPLPEAQVLNWMIQLCDALHYLHSQNPPVIHRDIKPANIRITPEGQVMLVDFGIAKVYDAHLKTTVGARAVTPGYSPPEQYGTGITDGRSDIYALGATLYMALTGQQPLESVMRMVGAFLLSPRAFRPDLSLQTEKATLQALELNPEQRFANAGEFKAALAAALFPAQDKAGSLFVPGAPVMSGRMQPAPAAAASVQQKPAAAAIPGPSRTPQSPPQATPASRIYRPVAPAKASGPPAVMGRSIWFWAGLVGGALLIGVVVLSILVGVAVRVSQPQATTPFSVVVKISATPQFMPTGLPERYRDAQGVEMALIPAGEFVMGSMQGEVSERPLHTVYLDSFYIDVYEVTNRLYQTCVEAGACSDPGSLSSHTHPEYYGNPDYANYPVIYVYWDQAREFCEWRGARLPSEAEWEKAARGGLESKTFPWGDESPGCARSNYYGCLGDTTQVDTYEQNGYGLYNMAGNVREWVFDWYGETYYDSAPGQNPPGPDTGTTRITRGGSWYSNLNTMRIAARNSTSPSYRGDFTGFRCAWNP